MAYSKTAALLTVVVVVVLVGIRAADGQATASCAQNLVPCAPYLNSTARPPNTCCDPLRETVKNDLVCLCNLYQTPGFLESLGVNLTQALGLSSNCGIPGDLSACRASSAPAPGSPNTPPPPGVPGNDVGRIRSTGLFSFLLVCASMMLY
ncbi:hypothetical protein LguiA_015523 [Lonicera macranthoides]